MRFAALLLGAALTGQAAGHDFIGLDAGAALPQPAQQAVERIDASKLRAHIAWLTAPEREGRGAGSRGLAAAVQYAVRQLQDAGVQPLPGPATAAGESRWLQTVPLREVAAPGGDVVIAFADGRTATARAGADAVVPQIPPGVIDAGLVFAGYGIRERDLGHDDFRDLDVRGRIVVFIDGMPAGAPWQTAALRERYAAPRPDDRHEPRLDLLEELGAGAAIAIEPELPARLRDGREPLQSYVLAAADAPPSTRVPLARITPDAARHLVELAGFDASQPQRYRTALGATTRARIRVTGRVSATVGSNVLGYVGGGDPALREQAVVIGAHLDHLGMHRGVLHPGADDNASGVATLIEMARSFATSPHRPRRSVIFAFWTAEEAGQFGSAHYVRQPLWPLDRTTAYINLDMIGHAWSRAEIERLVRQSNPERAAEFLAQATPDNFAEPGLAISAPWLADALSTAARGTRMTLHLDRTDGRNGGSDYRAFARADVPFIRFFGNFFPGYHEPGDTLETLDVDQVQRMARLACATAWLIADSPR